MLKFERILFMEGQGLKCHILHRQAGNLFLFGLFILKRNLKNVGPVCKLLLGGKPFTRLLV
jgi:hypothetical protein